MKPQFIILAGPNGAGKSTYTNQCVPSSISIFNGDLVFAELVKQYPRISADRLGGGVTSALEKARDKAIEEKKSFAFETNFSNNLAPDITKTFKDAGFETILFYFGLDNVDTANARVKMRVTLGGHNVPKDIIKFNMEEGIKRVNENLTLFDKICFYDTRRTQYASLFALLDNFHKNYQILEDNVKWFNTHFREPLNNFYLSHLQNPPEIEPDNKRGPKR